VPDTTSKIVFNDNKLAKDDIQFIIGPYEDYALSRAVELKEENESINISVLNVGLKENDSLLRRSLAVGADSAFRINVNPNDSNQVSSLIADFVSENKFDLILMGKESTDFNSGIVHHLVGSKVKYNSLSPVSSLSIVDNTTVEVNLEKKSSIEKIQVSTPVILGCQEPIADWKIPNMRGIMKARSKEINIIEKEEKEMKVKYENFTLPPKRSEIKYFTKDNISDLLEELKIFK
tara:strand:+ start:5291 stop:5992 length:702 start_codon:yes stop_codon:yes gene_type:complete